jgi:hypothetical protein
MKTLLIERTGLDTQQIVDLANIVDDMIGSSPTEIAVAVAERIYQMRQNKSEKPAAKILNAARERGYQVGLMEGRKQELECIGKTFKLTDEGEKIRQLLADSLPALAAKGLIPRSILDKVKQ